MNSGIIYDITRDQKLAHYEEAVNRAHFLVDEEKRHWRMMGYILTIEQLAEAERLILDEDLRQLATQEQLEKIKPIPVKTHG